ncbi:hypothetical protein BDF20DRAFT_578908 [Mycotypha africana]|uniref:uncharacterized protein n=1 Tax=Mycotypha africana TaxID=64632 RepID=UPI00230078B3|nr:uncharacterized protein BDF20DRAFT_578908 [Mycotypha africana]KAI8977637.1 hypothetical protein BDF20DRAFT_578908 [Mycotypha africana]
MAEVTVVQLWLFIVLIASIFLSGLCWCFCCGTCVGRSLLRNTGFFRFARDGADNSQSHHLSRIAPRHEELWPLNTWEEESEESNVENV